LQLGDVEQCALRSGNVHSADGYSADGWRAVLEPVISRYRGIVSACIFAAMRRHCVRVPMRKPVSSKCLTGAAAMRSHTASAKP
jgi:hypothetical protein